jgi:hypothetical protein
MSSKIEEVTPARFPAGTFDQINQVLGEGEPRSDFIREATEREILRRKIERTFRRDMSRRRVLYEKKRA